MTGDVPPRWAASGFAPGQRVASYILEERIGQGGMAVVFRALDERLNRRVALKVLAPVLAGDEMFRKRFIRESQAAAAVDDPNIIPVYEAGQADDVLFIAMRLVHGDVGSLVAADGPLPATRAALIIAAVASALDTAHDRGLVHRDVKPGNILLDARPGRPDQVYLSDFGISKAIVESSVLTQVGQFVGTVAYAAPEQFSGGPIDGRADQYALGCVAYELLSGAPPFRRTELASMMHAHLHEPPPQLSQQRTGLPALVDPVFARVLAKDPADRYPSCGQFAAALGSVLSLAPPDARADPAGSLAPWPAGFSATISQAAGHAQTDRPESPPGARDTTSGRWPAGGQNLKPAPRKTWRQRGVLLVAAGIASALAIAGGAFLATRGSTSTPPDRGGSTSGGAGTAPDSPRGVTAVAAGQYKIQVTWADASTDVTGFHIDNGCPVGSCSPGATLAQTTGPVRSATFRVTPGTYQCFRVQAFNASGASSWSKYGCTSTQGLVVTGMQEWVNTGVTLAAGDALGITAYGLVNISPNLAVGAGGDQSCTPAQEYPGDAFPAPNLHCWSLIARIGNATPFEVGSSVLVTAGSGVLYLGINDDSFSGNGGGWAVNIKIGGLPPPP